jgi:hypothetical protein
MAVKNTAVRNHLSEAFGSLWGGGVLEIRNSSGDVLVTFTLANPAFSSASGGGVAMASLPTTQQASVSGTASEARLRSSGATYQLSEITVGASGSGAMATISSTNVLAGQDITLLSFSWTEGTGFSGN